MSRHLHAPGMPASIERCYTAIETQGASYNHDRSVVLNRADNGWVHTLLANAECTRTHGAILAAHTRPPLPARLFQLMFQTLLFLQVFMVWVFLPSVAAAYDAYRSEEQVFNFSQAIRAIDSGRFKGWKGAAAPGMARAFYALHEGALLRDALLRMRADEACIHHVSAVLADLRPGDRNPFITSVTMDRERYVQLLAALTPLPLSAWPHCGALAARFGVSVDTVRSIYSLEVQARVLRSNHVVKSGIGAHARRWLAGADAVQLAFELEFSPCVLLRRLLEALQLGLARERITRVLRFPAQLPSLVDADGLAAVAGAAIEAAAEAAGAAGAQDDSSSRGGLSGGGASSTQLEAAAAALLARLQRDVEACVLCDRCYSPASDAARHAAGNAYEERLNAALAAAGVAFWTEDQLRSRGYHKTPDARLQVPIAVQGHIVNWIDSKATFGDDKLHRQQTAEQYERYVNRFGPGLVIYWHGFIADLNAEENVLLMDRFPTADEIKIVQVLKFNFEQPDEAVAVVEGPVPQPGQGQVLVKLKLRPVNPADIFSVQGVYPGFAPKELPAVPGLEGMGVVESNGPGASQYKPGQRVTAAPFGAAGGNGTWQEYVCVDEGALLAVPDGVSDEAAAQFLVNPVTAYGFFDYLKVPKGGWLLSNAASSVLGRMVIQLGKHLGVRTINVVRSDHHTEELKKLGADEVINSSEEDVVERVKQITGGKGAFAALECVGGEITGKLIEALQDGGVCLIYGAMAAFDFTAGIPPILFRGVKIEGFWLNVFLKSVGERRGQVMVEVMNLLEDGTITPFSGQHFPLEQAAEAIKHAQEPKRGGKAFLESA
ncbi:NAD(P)-binding [Micractinium conductrix]|uniref:Ubiquinol oxidase n=1 Tax=Micractinium conductrix TaxID=554055 RepID=A0A2P6VJL0_9CHLO|nr:NAD(P)-binding [Micractinium conductrix]|eukprot:PSC74291.1 NAD(P)-binding [Micractinium conductrix]